MVPVITCHSESVNIEFENDFTVDEVKYLLESMPGVVVFDLPHANIYPMPNIERNISGECEINKLLSVFKFFLAI